MPTDIPDDPDVQALLARQEEAYAGQQGGQLWVVNKTDGQVAGPLRARHDPRVRRDGRPPVGRSMSARSTVT